MKKILLTFWISALAIFTYEFANVPSHSTAFVKSSENRYEHAQSQTVFIQAPESSGSGFVIERISVSDGKPRLFIWTAAHVVDDCDEVSVHRILHYNGHRSGKMVFSAKVILRLSCDSALLSLNAPPGAFAPASFANRAPLPIGTPIFHVGNFLGILFEGSVSHGYTSQVGLSVGPWSAVDQADISAAPGASGGPVFLDTSGAVLGILVGGPAAASRGIVCYVPVRIFEQAAVDQHFGWAVRGRYCPDDAVINLAATAALLPKKADVDQKPDSDPVKIPTRSINHSRSSPKHAAGG